ncbi:hypothetical protein K1T34_42350 [Amycolatopsis sp. DSM 110486]|nr:hypothetical protein K1T34_42350 [Amycolatopsis sp. DSM 110486]
MQLWAVTMTAEDAIFTCAAGDDSEAWSLPRVWPGRGLGLPSAEVPAFTAAVGEVMKTPLYWRARFARPERAHAQAWAAPKVDAEDDFTYVSGPCGRDDQAVGYQPVARVVIALADLRGLRVRLAAHLHERSRALALMLPDER